MLEELVYNGFHKIFKIKSMIKGKLVYREKLFLPSAVAGCVVDTDGRMALVNQFRPSAGVNSKEVPAGILDKENLSSIETLIEELLEECEIDKKDIISINEKPIHEYFMVIGSSDAKLSIFEIVVNKQENKQVNDADVDSVEWVTLDEMKKLVSEGIIQDPKTLLSYYHLLNK